MSFEVQRASDVLVDRMTVWRTSDCAHDGLEVRVMSLGDGYASCSAPRADVGIGRCDWHGLFV